MEAQDVHDMPSRRQAESVPSKGHISKLIFQSKICNLSFLLSFILSSLEGGVESEVISNN